MADDQRDPQSLELPALFSLRAVGPLPAAALTGAIVGLAADGLVWAALRGCAGLRGTSSCGDAGLLVLLGIFVVSVVLGRVLLGAMHVPQAGSTALLAVALVTVIAIVVADDLTSLVGAVVVAALGAAAFAAAQRLTSSNTSPGDWAR